MSLASFEMDSTQEVQRPNIISGRGEGVPGVVVFSWVGAESVSEGGPVARRFSKVWDHPANKRKALFLSSWNCSIARVGEGETDFKILSA
ncbi:MAG: hypothetical protein ACLPXM_16915, partial [Terriglobales bacterium]